LEIKTDGYKAKQCAKIMRNPFMALTDWSVDRPKQAFSVVILAMVLLSAGAMHSTLTTAKMVFSQMTQAWTC